MSNAKKANYQIPLAQAVEWTTIWRIACPTNCKAFLIHIEDLMGVMEEMGVLENKGGNMYKYKEGHNNDIRAYMAIDPKLGQKGKSPEEKILIVGTEQVIEDGKIVYRDILNGKVDGTVTDGYTTVGAVLGDGEGDGSGVYDFSEPCPTTCDKDSELNGGG